MTEITLNKSLNKIDTIIFSDIDGLENRDILNYVRLYIINSIEHKKNIIKNRLWLY